MLEIYRWESYFNIENEIIFFILNDDPDWNETLSQT